MKLVRDKIPEILKKKGVKPVIRTADENEFIEYLKKKILEESDELVKARKENQELEEIVDILEALNAYLKTRNISPDALERLRKFKLRKRGGFEKRVILEGVVE